MYIYICVCAYIYISITMCILGVVRPNLDVIQVDRFQRIANSIVENSAEQLDDALDQLSSLIIAGKFSAIL